MLIKTENSSHIDGMPLLIVHFAMRVTLMVSKRYWSALLQEDRFLEARTEIRHFHQG
jgi:hypothetical protein